jgi:hypothetical protein
MLRQFLLQCQMRVYQFIVFLAERQIMIRKRARVSACRPVGFFIYGRHCAILPPNFKQFDLFLFHPKGSVCAAKVRPEIVFFQGVNRETRLPWLEIGSGKSKSPKTTKTP